MLSFARFTCIYPVTLLKIIDISSENYQLNIIEQADTFDDTIDGDGFRARTLIKDR